MKLGNERDSRRTVDMFFLTFIFKSLIGNFLNLSVALMGANLLKIVRVETKRLSDELDNCKMEKRDPLFHAELGFDKNGEI